MSDTTPERTPTLREIVDSINDNPVNHADAFANQALWAAVMEIVKKFEALERKCEP